MAMQQLCGMEGPMTEHQIEGRVERMMDNLDRLFMAHCLTPRQYEAAVLELEKWAEAKYAELAAKEHLYMGV
jgi:hypothetical protein